jgi:hypothetical protein
MQRRRSAVNYYQPIAPVAILPAAKRIKAHATHSSGQQYQRSIMKGSVSEALCYHRMRFGPVATAQRSSTKTSEVMDEYT